MAWTKITGPRWQPTGQVVESEAARGNVSAPTVRFERHRLSAEALKEMVLRLRSERAAKEQEILSAATLPLDFDSSGSSLSQLVKQYLAELETLLEAKQRATQALRLRAHFSSASQFQLEERQGLSRCVALQRRLAALDSSGTEREAPSRPVHRTGASGGDGPGRGWSSLEDAMTTLSALLAALAPRAGEALKAVCVVQTQAESAPGPTSREQQEHEELERSIAKAREEIVQLRNGRGNGEGDAASEASLLALHEEASALRAAKSQLEEDVQALISADARNARAPVIA